MKSEIEEIEQFLFSNIQTCRACGTARTKVPFESIPDEQKKRFASNLDDIDYFLHCSQCNEYSAIGVPFTNLFDDEETDTPKRYKREPSLNAECSCGSGKKYKRCCGKK